MDLLELGADIPVREKDVLRNIFIEIEEKIRICNPYVKQFIFAKDLESPPEMKLLFHPEVPTGSHVWTYNAPTHELTVCTTDDMQLAYPPLVLKKYHLHYEEQ